MASFRQTGRRASIAGGACLLLLLALASRVGDARLLDAANDCPGLWAWVGRELALAAGWIGLAVAGWRFLPRILARPRVAVAAVLLLAAAQLGLRVRFPFKPPIDFSAAAARHGHDLGAYQIAAAALAARVMSVVPENGRVALVHDIPDVHRIERVGPRVPLFLFSVTAPRVYYLYEGEPPGGEALAREGIGWILDLRQTGYQTGFAGASLRRVRP
jgi:hypothetical protein